MLVTSKQNASDMLLLVSSFNLATSHNCPLGHCNTDHDNKCHSQASLW